MTHCKIIHCKIIHCKKLYTTEWTSILRLYTGKKKEHKEMNKSEGKAGWAGETGGRLQTLDLVRGLTIISMVLYHGMWDFFYLSRFSEGMRISFRWYQGMGGHLWQQSICRSFILLAGFCVPLSKNIIRRGLLVSACGILVSAVTIFAAYEERVLLGVLTFHGAAMLLAGAVRQLGAGRRLWKTNESVNTEASADQRQSAGHSLQKHSLQKRGTRPNRHAGGRLCGREPVRPGAGALVCVFMFHITRWVNRGYLQLGPALRLALPSVLYNREGAAGWILTALGFPMKDFFSTDYFSLFPWIFLFQTGISLYRMLEDRKALSRPVFHLQMPLVNWIGQHSLLIYLIHQPLLYLLVSVINCL